MIMLVLISNLRGRPFPGMARLPRRTHGTIGFGLAVLCAAVMLLTYGNYLGGASN